MNLSRRSLFGLIAAPAVVCAANLMPVRALARLDLPEDFIVFHGFDIYGNAVQEYLWAETKEQLRHIHEVRKFSIERHPISKHGYWTIAKGIKPSSLLLNYSSPWPRDGHP